MRVSLEDTLYVIFHTNDAAGNLQDADSAPTSAVFEDSSASAAMGSSVANVTTGEYRCTVVCTAANGYELGKWYNLVIAATVDTINSKKTIATFQIMAQPTTEGIPEVDVTHWQGGAVQSDNTGIPNVNVAEWLGGTVASPTTAGVPEVDVTHWAGDAALETLSVPGAPVVVVSGHTTLVPPQPVVSHEPRFLKQSESTAARRRVYFQARANLTNGATSVGDPINSWSSVTMTGRVSKNGAAGAAHGGTFAKVDTTNSPGLWYYEFTAGELDTLGMISLYVESTGILTGDESDMVPLVLHVQVITPDLYDVIAANVTKWDGTAVAAPTVAGIPKVEVSSFVAAAITSAAFATSALEAIRDKVLDYPYRTGRTVRGLLRRLGASLEFVTGLNGSTVTFKQPDNSTTEFSVTQDTTNGTRTAVTVTNSETP